MLQVRVEDDAACCFASAMKIEGFKVVFSITATPSLVLNVREKKSISEATHQTLVEASAHYTRKLVFVLECKFLEDKLFSCTHSTKLVHGENAIHPRKELPLERTPAEMIRFCSPSFEVSACLDPTASCQASVRPPRLPPLETHKSVAPTR